MMGSVEEADFGDGASGAARRPELKVKPRYLKDEARIRAYLGIAALVDSGLDLAQASQALSSAYAGRGQKDAAEAVSGFFSVVGGKDASEVADLATRVFGDTFVSAEEEAVLSALPASRDKAATLRAAAAIVPLKERHPAVSRATSRAA